MSIRLIRLVVGFFVIFCYIKTEAQNSGDYRSKNPAGGNWNAVGSWERFDGTNWVSAAAIPTSADGVITVRNGHTITINTNSLSGDQLVVDPGGTLEMAPGAGVNFTLNNGTGDDLTVNGTMTWNSGNIFSSAGISTVLIATGGTLTNASPVSRSFDVALIIATGGTMNWNDGNMAMSGSITNSGTLNITGNNSLTTPSLQPVDNNGTITKTSSGTTISGARINNNGGGIINLNNGILTSSVLYTYSNSTFNFANAAVFNNIAQFSYNGGTIQGTGSFINNSNSILTINENLGFSPGVIFTDNSGAGINGIQGSGNLTINNDFVINSNINGSGSLTVNGNIDWQNSVVFRSLSISAGRTLTLSTAATKELSAAGLTINANGILNWNNGLFRMSSNASITNNGTIHIAGNNELLDNTGTCFLVNNNLISKNSTGATIFSTADITNAPTGTIQGLGTIDFNTPVNRFHNNGAIAPGLSSGILTVNSSLNGISPFSASSILHIEVAGNGGAGQSNGHDQLQRAGTLTLNGTLTVTETGTVPGGDYVIISLISGAITGSFAAADLPPFYSIIYNANNVVLRKEGFNTYYHDVDADGFGNPNDIIQAGTPPPGYVTDNTDCNDNNAGIHPGATEVCNEMDDDCDGLIDEGVQTTYCRDNDGDGYGDPNQTTLACAAPEGFVSNNTDCNDNNAAVHPAATEVCNGIDDDCDGQIDEGVPVLNWYRDIDGDGYGNVNDLVQACSQPAGYVAINTGFPPDCNDNNSAVHPFATEICNGMDDNCNGQIDEGVAFTWLPDSDGDGYGRLQSGTPVTACSAPAGYVLFSLPAHPQDCNDNDPAVHPFATEICNGTDDDCDGQTDEGLPTSTWVPDGDGDGYGRLQNVVTACSAPAGYVLFSLPAFPLDCNDNNPAVHPFATETCNGIDDDCDGQTDEGLPTFTWAPDGDGDGYGRLQNVVTACSAPAGYVLFSLPAYPLDCNDNNPAVHPFATETCNGTDDDCDGLVDEGILLPTPTITAGGPTTFCQGGNLNLISSAASGNQWYKDGIAISGATAQILNVIASGIYTVQVAVNSCVSVPSPGILITVTPQPATPTTLPGGSQTGCQNTSIWYLESSSDTGNQWYKNGILIAGATGKFYGATTSGSYTVRVNINGCVSLPSNATVLTFYPNQTFYRDQDADGYGTPNLPLQTCIQPAGYVSNNTDCNDNNAAIHPGAVELCNGIDDDCDGQMDEGAQPLQATILPNGIQTICSGTSLTLQANTGTGYLYQWFRNGSMLNGQTASSLAVNSSGAYYVRISGGNCVSTSLPVIIITLPSPPASIHVNGNPNICNTGSVQLEANAGVLFSYQWKRNGLLIAGATQRIYVATQPGSYTVTVTRLGCSTTSSPALITNSCQRMITAGNISEEQDKIIQAPGSLTIYPNPTKDRFIVEMNLDMEATGEAVLQIISLSGKTVLQKIATIYEGKLRLSVNLDKQCVNGMYLVKVIFNKKIFTSKLIKM